MRPGPDALFWETAQSAWDTLQEQMNRLLRPLRQEPETISRWAPRVDVLETDEAFLVQVDLPGVKPEELEVSIAEGILTIRGERKPNPAIPVTHSYVQERPYGPFQRAVQLPGIVDVDKVTAEAAEGIVTITLPKKPETKPRHISVQAK